MSALPATQSHDTGNLQGMGLAALAFALLTGADTLFKLTVAEGHPPWQILFVNGMVALLPIVLWSGLSGGLHQLGTRRVPMHLARGSASVMSAFAAIYAYARLPLTDYYAIVFAGPLLVTMLSALWLGEKVSLGRGVAISTGLLGILVVANPFGHPSQSPAHEVGLGRFAAFVSVFCYALSVIMIRRMRVRESNLSFSFYGYVACTIIGGVGFALKGGPAFTYEDIERLALAGLLAGSSSICLMTAYHRTPVALVAPFQYTQIIWGGLAGWLLWAQLPSLRLLVGAAIVAASGFYVIYGEIRMRRRTDRLAVSRIS